MRSHCSLLLLALTLAHPGAGNAAPVGRSELKAKIAELRNRGTGGLPLLTEDLTLANGTKVVVSRKLDLGGMKWQVHGKRAGVGLRGLQYLDAKERREAGKMLTPHLGGERLVIEQVDKTTIAAAFKALKMTPNERAIERLKAIPTWSQRPARFELRPVMSPRRFLRDQDAEPLR